MPKVWNKRDPNCPKDAVYVGRPSKWGNLFKIGVDAGGNYWSREDVISLYRSWMSEDNPASKEERDCLSELKGKDLVCWCAPLPCHADVLLELANKES